MVSRQRLFYWVTLLLVLSLLLVACERPAPGGNEVDETATSVPDTETSTDTTADDSETDVADDQPSDTEVPDESEDEAGEGDTPRVDQTEETSTESEGSSEEVEEGETTGESEADSTEEDSAEETSDESESAEESDDSADEESADGTEEADDDAEVKTPTTHTVVAGENLYRIGLKYSTSWVTLAEVNKLANANDIKAGQVLTIPGDTDSAEEPEPTPEPKPEPTPSPLTETTYTVKLGDNLYRIGLAYGIGWDQIAEANGLLSPNQIIPGQELKIPVDTPGPTPQFTHEVKAGETLFLISLQYGVPWPVVAEENEISSPWVIYTGQTLVIPGGQ